MLTESDMRLIAKAYATENEKLTTAIAKGFAPAIKAYVEKELAGLSGRIAELEKRQAGLMNFRGIFQKAQRYERGDCVTSDGGLWFCIRQVDGADGKPGTDAVGNVWQLTGKTR